MDIEKYMELRASAVNRALPLFASRLKDPQPRLAEAMLYSLSAGGKRLRPVLLGAAYEVFGGRAGDVLPAACALEMVHTYSLVHDDLPAMDNDDLRRGRPTSHKAYGEAMAILAGDALLTDAFTVLLTSKYRRPPGAERLLAAAAILARRAGAAGMVSGQAADLAAGDFVRGGGATHKPHSGFARPRLGGFAYAENRLRPCGPDAKHNYASLRSRASPSASRARAGLELLSYIHRHKTADLITAAVEMGAVLAGARREELRALSSFGRELGLCFQVADDILDVEGDKKKLGKSGSDARNKKLTYASLLGVPEARRRAEALMRRALARLESVKGDPAAKQALAGIARFACGREH